MAGEKMIVFKEQVVEKSTHCANCRHYDGDKAKIMEEWRPIQAKEIERIKAAIKIGGIQFPGWQHDDAGLRVAELTRTGMDVATAIRTLEQELLHKAVAVVGSVDNLYMADERYQIVEATERGINDGRMGRCRGDGVDGKGNPVGFLVFSGYHCHKWSGATGFSLAHEGRPLDPLPAELIERAEDKIKRGE